MFNININVLTLVSWLQECQQQIYRNFLAEDAFHLILGGFKATLIIFVCGVRK